MLSDKRARSFCPGPCVLTSRFSTTSSSSFLNLPRLNPVRCGANRR
ncbi:cell division protein [Dethiosulfatarculus sandiegensis]|uniref:Cell division protein n=1 Tax=Dethiosulfatarculus sandiegensis TaxID=1429043 RepID=A0A0D2GI31_9BACT|nr:cell division protein [Dethiosulfatarculus sandiegensis]